MVSLYPTIFIFFVINNAKRLVQINCLKMMNATYLQLPMMQYFENYFTGKRDSMTSPGMRLPIDIGEPLVPLC